MCLILTELFTGFINAWAIIALFFAILVYFNYDQITSRFKNKQHFVDSPPTGICLSPECVRCFKSVKMLNAAMKKYSLISKERDYPQGDMYRIDQSYSIYNEGCKNVTHDKEIEGEFKDINTPTPVVFTLPGLRTQRWWVAHNAYSELTLLQTAFKQILREFTELYKQINNPTHWTVNTTPSGQWRLCSLVNQGVVVVGNACRCPATMGVIESMSCYMRDNVFGNVLFSVLYPGTSIEGHCGPTNIRLRSHLGLVVPEGRVCTMMVGGEERCWREGEVLVFDDSFIHSVQYDRVDHDNVDNDYVNRLSLSGGSKGNYCGSINAEDYRKSVDAEDYCGSVNAEDYRKSINAEDYRKSVNAEDYCGSINAEDYRKSVNAEDYRKSVNAEDYRGSINAEDYRKSVNAEDYCGSVNAEDYCGSVNGDTVQMRAVLMVDLWHPNVTATERSVLSQMFSPYS